MRHAIVSIVLTICLGFQAATAQQQFSQAAATTELHKLLSLPAPPPRAERAAENQNADSPRYSRDNPPPEDAPAAALLDYWSSQTNPGSPSPSDAVRKRLLAACESEPERLLQLLPLLTRDAAAAERVKHLYDEATAAGSFDEDWNKKVRDWLRFNSRYFLGELQTAARKAKDKDGYVDREEALQALANVDWPSAEPLLQSLSGGEPRTSALAIAILYRHAVEAKNDGDAERYRARLRTIAAARSAPARARDTAIDALSMTEWTGREEWYLALLADETLLEPTDGHTMFSPLTTLFDQAPEKWIPVMAKLVESPNRAVQQAAASCLVRFATETPRRDAILPVLRWLSDPDWLDINGTQRAWFIQKMDELDMPESVPGLIRIIEHEESNRGWAARTLAHYKDPRAIPVLKKALAQGANDSINRDLIQCLLASGGLTDAEQITALEAYAAKIATPEGRADVERYRGYGDPPLNAQLALGQYLAGQEVVSDSLAARVLARAESLQATDATLARSLLALAQGWQARQVEVDLVRRIGAGTADAATIARALEQRERLRASVGPDIRRLTDGRGAARGIAVVLLEDAAQAQSILDKGDPLAQFALLACARLAQMALTLPPIGALLKGGSAELAQAAERYLLAEDSPEARQLLLERHPNAAFITGWRENVPMIGGGNFDAIARFEEKLRAEVLGENGPREIHALLMNDEHGHKVLRVYANRAVYTVYEDAARYREYPIPPADLARFESFVSSSSLIDSGPQSSFCHHDCFAAQVLSMTRQGGRRVFGHQGFFGWGPIFTNFDLLEKSSPGEVHYYLARKIKSLEILYRDETNKALDVWRRDAGLLVFVERAATAEEIEQNRKSDATDEEEDDEAARAEQRRQAAARARARFSWRTLDGGKLGEAAASPAGYFSVDETAVEIEPDDFPAYLNRHLAQSVTGGAVVLARSSGEGGLWRKAPGAKPVRLSGEGAYADPIVSPDGKWAVAAKTDSDWSKPNFIVRLHLPTRREFRVNLPPADQFTVIAYVAAHGKFLLRRARDEEYRDTKSAGPEHPEYHLLDAATGRTQPVTGEFAPLQQTGGRSLQPTDKAFESWAAIPDRAKNLTRVGRYHSQTFRFQPAAVVPDLLFDSFSMCVEEKTSNLLVVYEGQLLRLPMSFAP